MSAPNAFANLEVWFLTGSQHLYGPETLQQVAWQSAQIAGALEAASAVPGPDRVEAGAHPAGRDPAGHAGGERQ